MMYDESGGQGEQNQHRTMMANTSRVGSAKLGLFIFLSLSRFCILLHGHRWLVLLTLVGYSHGMIL